MHTGQLTQSHGHSKTNECGQDKTQDHPWPRDFHGRRRPQQQAGSDRAAHGDHGHLARAQLVAQPLFPVPFVCCRHSAAIPETHFRPNIHSGGDLGYSAHYPCLMPDPTKRMDRAEIARRVERAEKLLQKGKTGDALDEYMQVLAEDQQNDNVRQMAADLCLSLQRTPEAVKLLGELFERQVEAGENTRASLTYKKLARYATPTSVQRLHFGQILETSNRKLALETYESALEDLTKNGRPQDCVLVLQRLVALEPSEQNFLR